MKLYCIPGACSRAANILLRENGITPQVVLVDPATKRATDGTDYLAINPLGYVPALEMEDGSFLLENTAVLQWIADTYGPKPGNALARARMTEELSFISCELHKAFSPFFSATPPEGDARDAAVAKIRKLVGHYEATYLKTDRELDAAIVYAFVVIGWADYLGLDISDFTATRSFLDSFARREAVKAAAESETELATA